MNKDELLIGEWLSWMRAVRKAAGGTVAIYETTMRAFVGFCGALESVDAPMVEAFLLRPRRGGREAAAATQARERATVQSFYSFAARRGLLPSDPTVDVPVVKVRNRQPKAVDDRVWNQFWTSGLVPEDRVWLGLCVYGGLRRREVAFLPATAVDMDRGRVTGVLRKGGDEDIVEFVDGARLVALRLPLVLPDVDQWLDEVAWLASQRQGFTLTTLDASSDLRVFNVHLSKLLRRAGLKDAFTPHALRHTCATNLLRCGVPLEVAADYLGHSSPNMTMRYLKTSGRMKGLVEGV